MKIIFKYLITSNIWLFGFTLGPNNPITIQFNNIITQIIYLYKKWFKIFIQNILNLLFGEKINKDFNLYSDSL